MAELDREERAVVARIVADVGLLLGGEAFGMERAPWEPEASPDLLEYLTNFEAHLAEPDDPAILRLLPNAAPTDCWSLPGAKVLETPAAAIRPPPVLPLGAFVRAFSSLPTRRPIACPRCGTPPRQRRHWTYLLLGKPDLDQSWNGQAK